MLVFIDFFEILVTEIGCNLLFFIGMVCFRAGTNYQKLQFGYGHFVSGYFSTQLRPENLKGNAIGEGAKKLFERAEFCRVLY